MFKTMDSIFIPSVNDLVQLTTHHVDRFCGYSKVLDSLYRNNATRATVTTQILRRMSKRREINDRNIFSMLAEPIMTLVTDSKTEIGSGSVNKIRNTPVVHETFDKDLIKTTEDEIKEIGTIMKNHKDVLHRTSEAQKAIWKTHGSVTKYNILISTAVASRQHLQNELSKKDLNTREKSINSLKKTLEKKRQIAENVSMIYFTNLSKEEENRKRMIQVSQDLQATVTSKLAERLSIAMKSLKNLISDFVPDIKGEMLLQKLDNIKIQAYVDSLYQTSSKKFTFPIPMDYLSKHGFETSLPTGQIEIPPRRDLRIELAEPDNYNNGVILASYFIQKNASSSEVKQGFLKIKNGMKIKQKSVYTKEKIGFGWAQGRKPWSQKKWGFFEAFV